MIRILGASLVCAVLLAGCAGVPAGSSGPDSPSPSVEATATAAAAIPSASPTQVVVPSPSLIPSTLPLASPDPESGRTWVQACQPADSLNRVLLWDVAPSGSGLATVGHLGVNAQAVWASEDGHRWQRSDLPTEGVQFAYTVASRGTRVVVGGATGEDEAALVWTRDAGTGWTRRQLAPDGGVRSAAAAPAGFVLVGETERHVEGGRPTIWYSPDGLGWERVGPGRDAGLHGAFSDVVATATGFIAFGLVRGSPIPELGVYPIPEEARYDGVPWTSPDGVTWQPVADRTPFAWAWVRAITTGPRGLTAVGLERDRTTGDHTAAVWTSIDGLSWTRVDVAGTRVPTRFDLAAADRSGRLAAFSRGDGAGGAWFGRWWTSDNGTEWEEVDSGTLFRDVSVNAVTGFGAGFVAVGQGSGGSCSIWLSPAR